MQNEKDATRDGVRSPNHEKLKAHIRKMLTRPQTQTKEPTRQSRVGTAIALSF
jgi:hypothetical protein